MNPDCQQRHAATGRGALVQLANICTFTQFGQGICHGDSGTPLVVGNELVGIGSWAVECGTGSPDVFTRVANYVDWIAQNTW